LCSRRAGNNPSESIGKKHTPRDKGKKYGGQNRCYTVKSVFGQNKQEEQRGKEVCEIEKKRPSVISNALP